MKERKCDVRGVEIGFPRSDLTTAVQYERDAEVG
jgi:hypothetical protein